MPSFDDMKKMYSSTVVGEQIKEMSNMIMNETFSNTTTYRRGIIYDCNMQEIKEMEFKFLKTKTYTIEKDQVEYMVQFRPGVNPEIDFDYSKDQKHRLGYYIDILDENTKMLEKWLIVGKDKSEFDKYNVLKCNWVFEWLDENREYHKCLGCVRDRNSYNSGVWSDGFTTSVENQTAFFVPTNDETRGIDYGMRFMITDNPKHPKTYEITKVMDTFPLGATKIVLSQSHYNEHTDFCGVDYEYFGDEDVHMLCDFYSNFNLKKKQKEEPTTWKLSKVSEKLYVKGQKQIIQAIPSKYQSGIKCNWHIFIDNKEKIKDIDRDYNGTDTFIENYYNYINNQNGLDDYYLHDYFDIEIDEVNNTLSIYAKNKDIANYIIKVAISDEYQTKPYYDFVEMEVSI